MNVQDLFDLSGKIALITGGAGHLGAAMVEGLCEAGARVWVNGRDQERLDAFASHCRQQGFDVRTVEGDITQADDVSRIQTILSEEEGALHVLVNNAYSGITGTLASAEPEDFIAAYQSAVVASFMMMKSLFPLLYGGWKKTGQASSVINISSMYGFVSPDLSIYGTSGKENPPFYGTAKAALHQLTKYAACEWAKKGIRVNSISPGPFPPPSIASDQPDFYKRLCSKTPMGRTGDSYELKGAVVFLASNAASFVTGTNIAVDGGWTAW